MSVTTSATENFQITFPVLFSGNSTFRVAVNPVHMNNDLSAYIRLQTSGSFYVYYNSAGVGIGWIAIGY